MKIKFTGATDSVTGSKHLLMLPGGEQVLLDCGLYQGRGADTDTRNRFFDFFPAEITAVVLSHAHIDHSGNLPLLVKQGFSGKIYCTAATRDLCHILLRDSAHIHENDTRYLNKRRAAKGQPPLEPLYTVEDAEACLSSFEPLPYNKWKEVLKGFEVMFTEAGHILGSAVVNMKIDDYGIPKSICFTGDVGRSGNLLLKAPAEFPHADYIISEATYGDRIHENADSSNKSILHIIHRTCCENKGKLLIPAFSLGRTQEIIYTLNNLKNAGLLPDIKVFVDSPLSLNATSIMRQYVTQFNESVQEVLEKDDDPFGFKNLHYVQTLEESKRINDLDEPCIIISASGMLEAGRIKHHLKNNINSSKNCLLLVGYCTPDSLGGKLKTGAKKVKIFGEEYKVKIRVETMEEYSGHAGQDELLAFLRKGLNKKLKKLFLVHGEEEAKVSFKKILEEQHFPAVHIPRYAEEIEV